jgi:hypothetical protein
MSSNLNNIIITILGLTVLSTFVFGKENTIEAFGMNPSQTFVVDRVAGGASVPAQYAQMLNPAAAIRYQSQMAAQSQMGGQAQPMSFVGAIKEQFCPPGKEGYCNGGSCSSVGGCRRGSGGAMGNTMKSSNLLPSGYSASNMVQQPQGGVQVMDMLPVQSMANAQAQIVNALGEASLQPIVYDRLIYANQKSRLYGLGDPIRGDLAIVPSDKQWFTPSVRPSVDLRTGAMAVMGGVDNASNSQLLAMTNAATAGLMDTGSGIAYTAQKNNYLSTGSSDIRVSAFP